MSNGGITQFLPLILIFIIFYLKLHKKLSFYVKSFFPKKIISSHIKKIIALGFPSALHSFFEVGFFISAVWMSGLIGKNAQAANQIVFEVLDQNLLLLKANITYTNANLHTGLIAL
mgnify:CR=1 FL=1